MDDTPVQPDFQAAEMYLSLARDAYDTGDQNKFIAARKLIMVALGITDALPSRRAA